jgi:hypothetical protein
LSDYRYDPALLERRFCGKSGQPDDLASAHGLNADSLGRALRRMGRKGAPVTVVDHPLQGVIYRFEKPARTCRHKGCKTILSRYNSLDYCSLHQPKEDLPERWFLTPNRRTT